MRNVRMGKEVFPMNTDEDVQRWAVETRGATCSRLGILGSE
jgi:hypothetical protein